jgi:hypothetical protein
MRGDPVGRPNIPARPRPEQGGKRLDSIRPPNRASTAMDTPVELNCPQCGVPVRVTQVQGDRCPGCRFEYNRFGPGESLIARDYHAVLTGPKHLVELPGAAGWIVAHE